MANRTIDKQRRYLIVIYDIVVIMASLLLAFSIRYDFQIPAASLIGLGVYLLWALPVKLSVFYFFGLYRGMYRYTSIWDLVNVGKATVTAALIINSVFLVVPLFRLIPPAILLLDFILTAGLIALVRLSVRLYFSQVAVAAPMRTKKQAGLTRLLLLGAGNTGEKIARDILTNFSDDYQIVGFLDDNPEKIGSSIHGIPVIDRIAMLNKLVLDFDEILITAPSTTGDNLRRIVELCKVSGKRFKTVPSLNEVINKDISLKSIRDVSYLDLLGREEVQLDIDAIEDLIKGKRILISGAGGSIGSELVRQCLEYDPGSLILLDNSEQNLFSIEQEIAFVEKKTLIRSVLANIRDKNLLQNTFQEYRPQVVIHAAAYKHVPMQELHPWSAVSTNVMGTLNLVQLAHTYNTEKFVLVSTDKAVHPVNIMGATKRLAEKVIQSVEEIENSPIFLAVRFGNVIGSSGSVIPIFRDQINRGGPVTITHPEMSRYFMSIPEAAQLTLQAGAMGDSTGQIFLLDMGKAVKIVDMANDLIRLSGLEPEKDIPIIYTGLRPGEKLYEELISKEEKAQTTDHKKIMVLQNGANNMPWPLMQREVQSLIDISMKLDPDAIKRKLQHLIPDYTPQDFYALGKDLDLDVTSVTGKA
jgi:FlaA1/EpsC-like NDP-sugar epimerase